MKKIVGRFDTRKREINVWLFICAALLARLTVAPEYNPGVTTAVAHSAITLGAPGPGMTDYYRTADFVLDGRSAGATCIGDNPGSSGSGSGVEAHAH